MPTRFTARVGRRAAPSAATAEPLVPAQGSSPESHDWITCNAGNCRALLVFGDLLPTPETCPGCGTPTGLPVPAGEPHPKG